MPSSLKTTTGADQMRGWDRAAPWLILFYVAALAGLRVALSPYLEVDEAHFVGQTDLRLAYGNSHPPLYNWLFRGALELTGGAWAAAAALVKFPLLAAFHLLTWDAARRLGGPSAGLRALAASALMPQIVWMSALTLTHSVLVLAAAAAVANAGARLALAAPDARRPAMWAWFGAAMALGALAKYNFALFLLPYLAALLITPATRRLVADRRFAISAGVFALLSGPALAAALMQMRQTTGRMSKLFSEAGATAGLDVPGLGLDGLLSLAQACVAWAGPAALVWWLAARFGGAAEARRAPEADGYVEALGRAMAIALALFALIVLAGDMHRVRERYLTPMLASLPIWLAAARPLSAAATRRVALLGAGLYAAALVGVAGVVELSAHRLAYPYDALAAQVAARFDVDGATVIGARHADGANLALALQARGFDARAGEAPWPGQPPAEPPLLLVWTGDRPRPPALSEHPPAEGPAARITAPLTNLSGESATFSVERVPRRAP